MKTKVICLCGSTRFYKEWQETIWKETMKGNITLQVSFHPDSNIHSQRIGITPEQKLILNELHQKKIDLSDEILVINVNGYIGESTRNEIDYALEHGKIVNYLESIL